MYTMGTGEIQVIINHLWQVEKIAATLDIPKTAGLNDIEWGVGQVLKHLLEAAISPIKIEQQPRESVAMPEIVPMEMPPLLPHGSHHSFSNAMIGTGPEVRIARAEHEYNMLRESMLADRRITDLVHSGTITPEEGQLTKTRNIELAWESYAALKALIAEQRQSEAEAQE